MYKKVRSIVFDCLTFLHIALYWMIHPDNEDGSMRWQLRNISIVAVLALFVTVAGATSFRQTDSLPTSSGQAHLLPDFGRSKEGTRESFRQGGHNREIHQLSPSPLVPYRVEIPGCTNRQSLLLRPQGHLSYHALFYSSLCNKAPPIA